MHDAFISYSRRNADFARRIEKALEEFKPPRDLNVPQRYLDVFRDEADFTGVEYFQSVEQHLGQSAKMILVCSPAARASTYVGDEVRRFAQKHGAQNIIPILLDGLPNNEAGPEQQGQCAFPDALCEVLGMPLAIAYRGFDPGKDRINKGAFADSWFTLLANLYGISRADVERREKRRQQRNRRIVVGLVGGIITALTIALVVSLLFWQQAEADRLKAEKASVQERLARGQERAARLEERNQRKIAEEKRKEAEREFARAEREKAAAIREAIAARSETAGRLAVQALEKVDGKPHDALGLALAAVNTFHTRGDPVTPRAIGALQSIGLAFAGSRPALPWKKDRGPAVVDGPLRLAAASDADGTIVFGKGGTSAPRVLPPPRGVLRPGERWARAKAHLAFAGDRLIAMRGIVSGTSKEIKEGMLWSWHVGEEEIDSPPVVAARFGVDDWEGIDLEPSPDGRWAVWGGTWSDTILQRLDRPGEPVTCTGDCTPRQFTEDSRTLLIYTAGELRRFALGDAGATALPPLEPKYRPDSMAVIAREDRMRIATFARGGEAEWWDINDATVNGATIEHHELPNVFPAFTKDLEIRHLYNVLARTTLEWRFDAEALLVTVVEYGAREFGIAAVHDLKGDAWQPVEHRYELKAHERTSKDGYSVKDAGKLGVASARFFASAVLSVGFDGTVLYRDVDEGRVDERFDLVATGASFATFIGERAVIGKRDGKVLFTEGDEEERQSAPFNGHNAPITEVRWTSDRDGQRVERLLSADATGHTRIWDLAVPGAAETADRMRVTADWKWLIARDRVWPLDGADPLWSAQSHPALAKYGAIVAWNAEGTQFVTLELEENTPLPLVLRLWNFRHGKLPRAPAVERRFAGPRIHSGWNLRFDLATPNGTARVVLSNDDGLWLTDLRQQQPLRRIGGEGMTLLANGASADSRWLVAKRGEETVLIDTRQSKVTPFAIKAESVAAWSDDGRWLVIRTGSSSNRVVDLTSAKPRPIAIEADYVVLGKGRPPLTGSYTGDDPVHMWQAPGRFVEVTRKPKELAWDPSGRWLAIGHDAGRVWLTKPPAVLTAKELSAQVAAAMKQPPLPQPAEMEARADIYSLFAFPDQGWVIAELDDHLLLWHRGVSGTWEQPIVFTMKELRLEGIDSVKMRADGRMALIDNHVLSLDPAYLLAYSRRLVDGVGGGRGR